MNNERSVRQSFLSNIGRQFDFRCSVVESVLCVLSMHVFTLVIPPNCVSVCPAYQSGPKPGRVIFYLAGLKS